MNTHEQLYKKIIDATNQICINNIVYCVHDSLIHRYNAGNYQRQDLYVYITFYSKLSPHNF